MLGWVGATLVTSLLQGIPHTHVQVFDFFWCLHVISVLHLQQGGTCIVQGMLDVVAVVRFIWLYFRNKKKRLLLVCATAMRT